VRWANGGADGRACTGRPEMRTKEELVLLMEATKGCEMFSSLPESQHEDMSRLMYLKRLQVGLGACTLAAKRIGESVVCFYYSHGVQGRYMMFSQLCNLIY
jgi:hypothetical protein